MNAKPLSERLCDRLVFAFAGWTVLCNLTVLLGGGLWTLLSACAVVAVALAALAVRLRGRSRGRTGEIAGAVDPSAAAVEEPADRPSPRARLLVLALALGATVSAWAAVPTTVLWWGLVGLLAALAWRESGRPLSTSLPPLSARAEATLLALGLVFVLQPLLFQRPSLDDGFYLNLAVHAADAPGEALLAHDTLHGTPEVPLLYSVYRTHSIEILGGAVARLTGLSATQACHLVLPALFAPFVLWAWAALVRFLAPRRWPWILFATLAVLLLAREGNQFQGAFTLFRLHQGKAVFAAVFLPLVTRYAMGYAARPTRSGWGRLAAAQIASVGLTSTALWAAPVAATIGLLAGLPRTRAGLGRLARGLAASAYVLVLGAWLARDMTPAAGAGTAPSEGVRLVRVLAEPITRSDLLVRAAWETVFGRGALALAALLVTAGTWAVARSAGLRRLSTVAPLVVLLFLANPYGALEIARHVTGGATYWRVFWLLPVPLLLGTWLATPGLLARRTVSRAAGVLLAIGLFLALVPSGIEYVRGARWHPFGLKVPAGEAYTVARRIAREAPPGSQVLVPSGVAAWIVSLHHHPYPLATRPNWMDALGARLGRKELERRQLLLRFVTGYAEPAGPAALRASIERDHLSAVALLRRGATVDLAREVLSQQGFTRTFRGEKYETWRRP